LSSWIKTLASFIAPTTFITALLIFFGFAYTDSLYEYFGIDAATLAFSTQGYLLRSSAALFLPAGVVLSVALLAVLCHSTVEFLVARQSDLLPRARRVCHGLMALAPVVFFLGLLAGLNVLGRRSPMAAPLLMGGALALFVYAHLLAVRCTGAPYPLAREKAVLATTAALIALCSFWATNAFAQQKGTSDAKQLAAHLWLRPAVVLDTTERLYLQWSGLEETSLSETTSGQHFRYRYRGMRLLAQSGDQMFLIPKNWTWRAGDVLVVPSGPGVRVAFHAG